MALLSIREGHVQLRRDLRPAWIGFGTHQLCGLGGEPQRLSGRGVGERVVVDVGVGFHHRYEGAYFVAPFRLVPGRAAGPELSEIADHWPTVLAQPFEIVP